MRWLPLVLWLCCVLLWSGVYVWGKDWIQAKTQAECYDYLFEAAVRMAQLGISAAVAPAPLQLPASNGITDNKRLAENGSHSGQPWGGQRAGAPSMRLCCNRHSKAAC